MQKILKKILSLCLAVALCGGLASLYNAADSTVVEAATTTASTYYSGITAQSGTALLGQLHDLITTSRTKYSTYDDCHTKGTTTDPGSASNTVMEFYTQIDISYSKWDVSGGWNREHVWPKSDSNGLWKSNTVGGGADLHHIRPAEKDLNNSRASKKYGVVGTSGTQEYTSVSKVLGGYSNSSTFEPLDNVKGDVARILMYVYTHYNTYLNVGGTTNGSSGNSSYFGTLNFTHIVTASNEAAAKKLLLEWNKLDPVDEIETKRNDAVYGIQGNRNPFIDNESYADAIWGDGTVVNPGPGPQPSGDTLQSISLNPTELTMTTGMTNNLTVTPKPSNASASVNWTSSDESVATVSNGTVTAKAAGMATITATSTSNSAIKATATVTVLQSSSSETGTGKITITRNSFTNASGGYGLYNWSAGDPDGIEGTAYIYAGESNSMQFNTNKQPSQFLASTTPTGGAIKKVTIDATGNSSWTLLTSTQPYSAPASGNPQNGNPHDKDASNNSSWTVSGNDTYFALVLGGSGAAYINSIEVEYGTGSSSENPPELQNIAINPTAFTLKRGGSDNLSVVTVPSNATAEVTWTSSNPSVATVSANGTVTAVAAGTATITATSKNNPAIKATATVTVTAELTGGISEKVPLFREAVEAINGENTLSAWHTSINAAVRAYNVLSETDRTECAAEIQTLRSAIASYNEAVRAYNQAADAADEAALKGAGELL